MIGLLIPEITGRWRLVFQACLPSWFAFWASPGYSCRPVKLLSSFISFLSCSWLQPPCIPSLSSFSLSSLPLPPCFPSLSSSFLLGGCWQLSPCFPVLSSFSPFMILYLWFLYLFMCPYVMLALYACYWFMSSSMVPFYSPFFAICVGWCYLGSMRCNF